MIAEVIVDIANSEVDKIFDYIAPEEIKLGHRVFVPFGRQSTEGYVVGIKENSAYDSSKLKSIGEIMDEEPVITEEMLLLSSFMRQKYHLRLIDVLRLFVPSKMRGGKVKKLTKKFAYINSEYLNKDTSEFIKKSSVAQLEVFEYLKLAEGEAAVAELNKKFSAAALKNLIMRGIVLTLEKSIARVPYKEIEGGTKKNIVFTDNQKEAYEKIDIGAGKVYLIHGVTGSGKTEIYIKTITDALKKGKTAIMLVPEISLTPQFLKIFRSRFGEEIALLHSGLSDGERFDEWTRLLLGDAKIVLGARSAIFAPLKNLGVIIIDEEHDNSYISESNPRYHTHDVALFRKDYNGCSLIMGSATPSIESYYKAKTGEYELLYMPERVAKRAMPEITTVNMCDEIYAGNNGMFSRKLEAELRDCIENDNQAIIFINRRGYSSYVMCRSCGYVAKCSECDVSLVYHKEEDVLKCHYCNNRYSMLDVCPQCKSGNLKRGFIGTEKVTEELISMFPKINVLRMDNDTTQGKDAHQKILSEFAQKKANILVGTQMIAKGHDFPDVTLVGIVDADMSLYFADYRSNERTYQLITQVSGRAGRDSKPGKVVLQTYSPNHYVYRFAVKNDYKGFYEKECNLREVTKYPPFSKIVRVLVSSKSEELAMTAVKNIFGEIKTIESENEGCFAFCAAMRSPVKKIQQKFRMQILLRIVNNYDKIIEKVYEITDKHDNTDISLFIDINPSNLN